MLRKLDIRQFDLEGNTADVPEAVITRGIRAILDPTGCLSSSSWGNCNAQRYSRG
jgi:hypothetical protein